MGLTIPNDRSPVSTAAVRPFSGRGHVPSLVGETVARNVGGRGGSECEIVTRETHKQALWALPSSSWTSIRNHQGDHSARSASTALTCAARRAGSKDALIAAPTMINADAPKESTPGIWMSATYRLITKSKATPNKTPAHTPIPAMVRPWNKTSLRMWLGFAPTAIRMPNSRVRPLTENASTPATPTTEISSATVANPPNTTAFSREGVRTSARTSPSVLARSTGCSAEMSCIVLVTAGINALGSCEARTKRRPCQPSWSEG